MDEWKNGEGGISGWGSRRKCEGLNTCEVTVPTCTFFSHHQVILWQQLGALQSISPLILSIWDSIRFCRLRSQSHKAASPPQTPVTGWAVTSLVFLTHWLSLRGSHCPLLGFDYFPRVASRTQRNLSFTRLLAMIKGYNSGIVRWKRCIGQGMGKGPGASTLSALSVSVFTVWEALWSWSFWVFMKASLHRNDRLNHPPLVSDSTSTLLPSLDVELKVPTVQFQGWCPWETAPFLRCFPKVTSLI